PAIRSMFRPDSVMLCDPSRPESFAEAIIDLYQHPEKRERMAQSAAADYTPYAWEPMSARYRQLLRSLVADPEGGEPAPTSAAATQTAQEHLASVVQGKYPRS